MPLTLNAKHLEKHPVAFDGSLPPEELMLDIQDDLVQLSAPLQYRFVAEKHENGVLLQGSLSWTWECDCARCLQHFHASQTIEPWVLLLPFEGEDAAEWLNDCVDLTPYLREDMVLELPQRPLCGPDCTGLAKTAPSESPPDATTRQPEGPWQALDKLKLS